MRSSHYSRTEVDDVLKKISSTSKADLDLSRRKSTLNGRR